MVITTETCAWKNVPKIDNEGAHGTAAFDDARGDVVREMIEDDLMGKEFSNKWWGHVVASCSISLFFKSGAGHQVKFKTFRFCAVF